VRRPTRQQSGERRAIVVGLVNNMPDSAFADTDRQFAALLASAGNEVPVSLRRYAMSSIVRGPEAQSLLASYADASEIYDDPPDALIMTGTEPLCVDLTDEPYWAELSALLVWAQSSVRSVLLSCLAAHASVLAVDGLVRHPLPTKCCGVFPQQVHHVHPLTRGLRSVAFPHSRNNDVTVEQVRGAGYEVISESRRGGWTVASREVGGQLTLMFQGHPEYSRDTLLREYRRDVRRYLAADRDSFPAIPLGYLDRVGESLLVRFRDQAMVGDVEMIERFPFDRALSHVSAEWDVASARLMANWLARVAEICASSDR
jgi:homoserine O-succinyltransferase/O-acetyltransferase